MHALLRLIQRATTAPRGKKRPALFLHVRRTAGTSLVALARTRYAQSMVSHGDWDGRPASEFASVEFVAGHFGHDYAKHLMPGRYSFTFLRDPAARVLSMYRFCRNRVVNACKQAVDDFLAERHLAPEIFEIDGVGIYWRKT